jgi:hypothetical protein
MWDKFLSYLPVAVCFLIAFALLSIAVGTAQTMKFFAGVVGAMFFIIGLTCALS